MPRRSQERGQIQAASGFDRIEMRGIEFSYKDRFSETAFRIGPIDFTVQSGELVFITGGNGSGKSTFMRVLAGLYPPASGATTLDGMRITEATRNQYRALISTVFTDYHLFHRLYGISDPDPAEVDRLLRQFRLIDKTDMSGGEFRTLDLSDGQRKRLALIVSAAGKAADFVVGRVDGRPGPGISPQILPRTVAATGARRRYRRGDHPR